MCWQLKSWIRATPLSTWLLTLGRFWVMVFVMQKASLRWQSSGSSAKESSKWSWCYRFQDTWVVKVSKVGRVSFFSVALIFLGLCSFFYSIAWTIARFCLVKQGHQIILMKPILVKGLVPQMTFKLSCSNSSNRMMVISELSQKSYICPGCSWCITSCEPWLQVNL